MQMASEYDFERSANLGTVKASLIDNASGILAEFEINNPDDLLALELFHAVKGELPIKKCRCCGEYFVPSGRSDSEYCSRISLGENKRCAQIGAMRTFKGKYAENPIYAEYNRAYKRNHSRLRNGKLYDEEFRDWSAAARKARDEFIAENKKYGYEYNDIFRAFEDFTCSKYYENKKNILIFAAIVSPILTLANWLHELFGFAPLI